MLPNEQRASWIREQNGCWRCAQDHFATQCDLKGRCNQCNGKHLQFLCDINQRSAQNLYLDHPSDCNKVLLKVVECHTGWWVRKDSSLAPCSPASGRAREPQTADCETGCPDSSRRHRVFQTHPKGPCREILCNQQCLHCWQASSVWTFSPSEIPPAALSSSKTPCRRTLVCLNPGSFFTPISHLPTFYIACTWTQWIRLTQL